MLSSAGTTDLKDSGGTTYLTVQPTNPLALATLCSACWRKAELANPSLFNLLVVYAPLSGGVGVPVPVVVEQFNNVSLQNIAAQTSNSQTGEGQEFRRRAQPQPLGV